MRFFFFKFLGLILFTSLNMISKLCNVIMRRNLTMDFFGIFVRKMVCHSVFLVLTPLLKMGRPKEKFCLSIISLVLFFLMPLFLIPISIMHYKWQHILLILFRANFWVISLLFKFYIKGVPSYSHLLVFGCLCYPLILSTKIHKLQPRSTPYVFFSFPPNYRGYRCYDLSFCQLIIISRHVIFYENVFPIASLHSLSSHTYEFLKNGPSSYVLDHLQHSVAPISTSPAKTHTPPYSDPHPVFPDRPNIPYLTNHSSFHISHLSYYNSSSFCLTHDLTLTRLNYCSSFQYSAS